MGIYLIAIAFEYKQKVTNDITYSETRLCNALGILITMSSQVSITIIFIISFYRLISLVKPYKQHYFRWVVALVILTWIFWLVVAILPILPLQSLKNTFTVGLVKNRQLKRDSFIDFNQIVSAIQTKILPSFKNVTEVESILQAVTQFRTPSVMEKFSSAVGWVSECDTTKWSFVGHYDFRYSCSIDFFILYEEYRSSVYFSLILVCFNLVLSITIFSFYVIVTRKVYKKDQFCFVSCKRLVSCCVWKKVSKTIDVFAQANAIRSAENKKIFKRISLVLITDLLCWIPLCLISLIIWCISSFKEIDLIRYVYEKGIFIDFSFLILLSVNSILNPYLYSYQCRRSWGCSCNSWAQNPGETRPPHHFRQRGTVMLLSSQTFA